MTFEKSLTRAFIQLFFFWAKNTQVRRSLVFKWSQKTSYILLKD